MKSKAKNKIPKTFAWNPKVLAEIKVAAEKQSRSESWIINNIAEAAFKIK